jgi:hypothetical protein
VNLVASAKPHRLILSRRPFPKSHQVALLLLWSGLRLFFLAPLRAQVLRRGPLTPNCCSVSASFCVWLPGLAHSSRPCVWWRIFRRLTTPRFGWWKPLVPTLGGYFCVMESSRETGVDLIKTVNEIGMLTINHLRGHKPGGAFVLILAKIKRSPRAS